MGDEKAIGKNDPQGDKDDRPSLHIHDVLMRVHTWSAWLPKEKDPNNTDAEIARGTTALRLLAGETIIDCTTTALPFEADMTIVDLTAEGGEKKVPIQMFGFEVTTACPKPAGFALKDLVDPQPTSEDSNAMIAGWLQAKNTRSKIDVVEAGGLPGHKAKGGRPRPIR